MRSQPLVDQGDVDCRLVADGQLVVPSRDRASALESADPALHRVALAVVDLVERRRSATGGAPLPTVADLVPLLRNGAAYAASAQVGAVRPGPVGLVRADPPGPGARSTNSGARHPDQPQDRLKLRGVAPLARSDHDRQGLLPLLDREVDFRRQASAGATEAVVGRLGLDAAGRLLLEVPLLRAPAACWCARQTVESTETSQVTRPFASARVRSPTTTAAQVPSRCQRRNSPYTDSHGPYRSGMSRHGAPVRVRHRIPSISCRREYVAGRPGFTPTGSNGASTAHCSFVRSPRPTTRSSQTLIHFINRP